MQIRCSFSSWGRTNISPIHPSAGSCSLNTSQADDLRGAKLVLVGPSVILRPTYIPLKFPKTTAVWISTPTWVMYSLTQPETIVRHCCWSPKNLENLPITGFFCTQWERALGFNDRYHHKGLGFKLVCHFEVFFPRIIKTIIIVDGVKQVFLHPCFKVSGL